MASQISATIKATSGNEWGGLLPEAGSNRVHLVYIVTEMNGGLSADMPGTFSYNGVAYQKVIEREAITSYLRGITLFAAKEAGIATAEAGGGGVIALKQDGTTSLGGTGAHFAFCLTVGDFDQSIDLTAVAVAAGGFATNGGNALPHIVSIPANTGDLVIGAALTTQPDAVTWSNVAEIIDQSTGGAQMSAGSVVASADGSIAAGVSPDTGISYNTVMIGIALPDVSGGGGSNSDPALDTPISDISVSSNTSGTITDISTAFSDADLDGLTYSVSPALPSGMTLNTSTGVISGDGSITQSAAANYTFSADDGQGGTPASDVVSIEVTALANPGLRLTLRDAENSNAIIINETGLTVHIYDNDGGSELLTTAAETTDGSGVLEIDSDSIGSIASDIFIVAKRSNGQTCCGTVTIIDLDA